MNTRKKYTITSRISSFGTFDPVMALEKINELQNYGHSDIFLTVTDEPVPDRYIVVFSGVPGGRVIGEMEIPAGQGLPRGLKEIFDRLIVRCEKQ